jgi:hypothetical protein
MRRWVLLFCLAVATTMGCHPAIQSGTPVTVEEYASYSDIPLYPNALPLEKEPTVPTPDAGGYLNYKLEFETNDPIDSVRRFYMEQLKMEAVGNQEAWNFMGKTKRGNEINVNLVRTETGTQILLNSIAKELPRR